MLRSLFYKYYGSMYFHMYSWNLRMWGESDLAQYKIASWLSGILVVNVINLNQLLQLTFSVNSLDHLFGRTLLVPISIFALGFITHYVVFIRNSRFKTLDEDHPEIKETSSVTRSNIGLAYHIFTFGSFIALFQLRSQYGLVH